MPINQLQITLYVKYYSIMYIAQPPSLCNLNIYLPVDTLQDIATN